MVEANIYADSMAQDPEAVKLEAELEAQAAHETVEPSKHLELPTLADPSMQASFEAYMKDPEGVPACVIDVDTKEYEPTLEDIFIVIPSGDYQRLLFCGHTLREREETHLQDFRNYLKVKGLSIPAEYDDSNRVVLRFLQGLKWNYQQTHDEIWEHHKWATSITTLQPATFWPLLQSGILYGLKRDIQQHPVVVMNVRRIIDTNADFNQLMDMTNFFLNYTIEKSMVPGKVESWTCICDMANVGATQIPKDKVQGIVKAMSKNYRGRLFKFYACDVTFFVRTVWKFVHRFVDEFTNRKLLIFGDEYRPALHKQVDTTSLEKKYGGTLPDVTHDFFPPQFS